MSTAVKRLGSIGERMDLLIRQGATLGPFTATMTNPDGSPVDLTGASIVGQIRKTPQSRDVTAHVEVAIIEPKAGKYRFGISAEVTALIPAGADITKTDSKYAWDLELHDSSGRGVVPLYWGEVQVHREVTRAES